MKIIVMTHNSLKIYLQKMLIIINLDGKYILEKLKSKFYT